jgi:glycogen(starch) synthase
MAKKKQKPFSDEAKIRKITIADSKATAIAKKVKAEVGKIEDSESVTIDTSIQSLIAENSQASTTFEQLWPPTSSIDDQPVAAAEEVLQPEPVSDLSPDAPTADNINPANHAAVFSDTDVRNEAREPHDTTVSTHAANMGAPDDTATPVGAAESTPPSEKLDSDPPKNIDAKGDTDPLLSLSEEDLENTLLTEVAWEVCNQVGGIYTVIQSKVPATKLKWGNNYLLLGPYFYDQATAIFQPDKSLYEEDNADDEEESTPDPVKEVVKNMNSMGFKVHYGTWLIDGRPRTVLFDPDALLPRVHEYKYLMWEHHGISLPANDKLIDQVVAFGFQVYEFLRQLAGHEHNNKKLLAHFHEWMAGVPIPELRHHHINVKTVFTTHATMLGRYLAMNDEQFYDHLPFYNWQQEASHLNILPIVNIERAASHGAHIFSTVSDITAYECEYLIGRKPEAVLPNGLNILRFEALHAFQNLHKQYKLKIHEFVMGHFFHNYSFDLDKTLYFFTSGRFEYYNKGFDLTLEALARLNWKMKSQGIDKTVVMFFVTKNPYHSMNSNVLESRARLEEINRNCVDIQEALAEKLFNEMVSRHDLDELPNFNDLVDDYLSLRLRRNIKIWRNNRMPSIVTHNLVDEAKDPIMNFLKMAHLLNYREDRVKVVYHPDFISTANPLFRMEYYQFVRGCHLGIFPSYYEPWGYTPLECAASGVPSISTDLAGFGSYVLNHVAEHDEKGLFIVPRRHRSDNDVAEDLANVMLGIVKLDRRERIALRNRVEGNSAIFGWRQLRKYYDDAYARVLSYQD